MTNLPAILLAAAAITCHALITGLTVVLAMRYLDGRRRSRPRAERRRPHPDTSVGHPAYDKAAVKVPRAPEPASRLDGMKDHTLRLRRPE